MDDIATFNEKFTISDQIVNCQRSSDQYDVA